MKKLENRVALVVGSTSGIGEAIAKQLAADGAKVVVNGRRAEAGDRVVKEIEEAGGVAAFVRADISKEDECKNLVEETVEKFGGLDILAINAGVAQATALEDMTVDFWDNTMNINLRSAFIISQAAVPHLLKSEHAAIVTTASMAAIKAFDQQFAYGSSKAGIAQFTKMLAVAYAEKGIRANSIAPGVINTDILANAPDGYIDAIAQTIPMKRLGEPEEIAKLASFLVSDDASYITGQLISIDGGSTLA